MSKSEDKRIKIQRTSLDKPRKRRPTKLATLLKEGTVKAQEWDKIAPILRNNKHLKEEIKVYKTMIKWLDILIVFLAGIIIYLAVM